MTPRSAHALATIRAICEEHLGGRYELEVIDIYQRPDLATADQIVAAPTLVLHGRRDETASPSDAELLYGLLGSDQKRLVWFEESGHLLTEGVEADAVCDTVAQFVAEVTR